MERLSGKLLATRSELNAESEIGWLQLSSSITAICPQDIRTGKRARTDKCMRGAGQLWGFGDRGGNVRNLSLTRGNHLCGQQKIDTDAQC